MTLIFEKNTVSGSSVEADNEGINVDYLIVDSSLLVNVAATQGNIILYFKDSNTMNSAVSTGEQQTVAYGMAKVYLNVDVGSESEAAKSISNTLNSTVRDQPRQGVLFSNVTGVQPNLINSVDKIIRYKDPYLVNALVTGAIPGQAVLETIPDTQRIIGKLSELIQINIEQLELLKNMF